MKKQKYVTKNIFYNGMLFLFIILVFAVALIGDYVQYNTKDNEVRSFLAQQYNFSEEECVATISGDELIARYMNCVINSYCGINKMCEERCKEETLIGVTLPIETPSTFCSLYCHTIQLSDGMECKTEEVRPKYNTDFDVHFVRVFSKKNGTIDYYNLNVAFIAVSTGDVNSLGQPVWEMYNQITYNQTMCTPIYRNVTTFCATADDVKKVRGMIR